MSTDPVQAAYDLGAQGAEIPTGLPTRATFARPNSTLAALLQDIIDAHAVGTLETEMTWDELDKFHDLCADAAGCLHNARINRALIDSFSNL